MKTIFQAPCQVQQQCNQSLIEILRPLRKDQIMMASQSLLPLHLETLVHILVSDLNWFRRF